MLLSCSSSTHNLPKARLVTRSCAVGSLLDETPNLHVRVDAWYTNVKLHSFQYPNVPQ